MMNKTVLLLPAAVLALALGACSGADASGDAKADSASSAAAAPGSTIPAQPVTPSGEPAASTPAPATSPGGEHPSPPPVPESHGSATAYADCLAHAQAGKSGDERQLLQRTCQRMKPR
jgi:hypothetical protein